MNNRSIIICGICVALASAASFLIGRLTAMDSVAQAEADLIRREMEHESKVDHFEVLLDSFESMLDASSVNLANFVSALEDEQKQENLRAQKELERLLQMTRDQ